MEIDQGTVQKFRQGFTGAPAAAAGERKQVTGPLLAPRSGGEGSLYGVRVGVGPGVGQEWWLKWAAHPLVVLSARGLRRTLLLLPAPQKWQLGFWSFCILLFIICPKCACTQLFLVPYIFFVFCCLRRRLSRCKHCSKGSQVPGFRSQPVSAKTVA